MTRREKNDRGEKRNDLEMRKEMAEGDGTRRKRKGKG